MGNRNGQGQSDVNNEDDDVVYRKDNRALLENMSIAFAEFLGTALLVFVTCLGCTKGMVAGGITDLQLSLNGGLAVMSAIQVFAHISGALVNPAVTVCALIMGQTTAMRVPIYVVSQIGGSLTGYALVMAVTPNQYLDVQGGHCVTAPSHEISLLQAFVVEAVATSVMCFAICSSWDPRNAKRSDSVPLRIGFLVAMLGMAAGPYTGASMNPARSFGPAVWNGELVTHWIYWAGPVTGASITGIFYKKIFLPSNEGK